MDASMAAVLLCALLVCSVSGSEKPDACRQLEFFPIQMGKRLRGHVFTNTSVNDEESCTTLCFFDKACVSHNVGPHDNGKYICELSDADHNMNPEDLVTSARYGYRGTRNACSGSPCPSTHRCRNGFGEAGYICQCPTGYGGIDCLQDEDECAGNSHDCHADANCLNTIGSFSCACKDGHYGDGRVCSDKDECTANTHDCHADANCLNTIGSFSCACKDGYHGNGRNCSDKNECTANTHDCHGDADCSNAIGAFNCTCKSGFYGDGKNCTVIEYFMADFAESCDSQCENQGKRCVERGGFPGGNAKEIFAGLGFPCAHERDYQYEDNPGYAPSTQRCWGNRNIPDAIHCAAGQNASLRRLCPCA